MLLINITLQQWEQESLVYSTAQCDHQISILKCPDRSNTVNPALPEVEPCMRSRRTWLFLFYLCAFIIIVCVSLLWRVYNSIPTFCYSALLLLSTSLTALSPRPPLLYSLGVCGWDMLSLAVYSWSDRRQLQARVDCMDKGRTMWAQVTKCSWKNYLIINFLLGNEFDWNYDYQFGA